MPETVFVELEIEGSHDRAVGFVEGFRLARPELGPAWLSGEESLAADGLVESLLELARRHTRVVASQQLVDALAEAMSASPTLALAPGERHTVDYAELAFDFRCFDREDGSSVRGVVEKHLPDGVRLEDYSVEEEVAADAKGVELYSPVHEYVVSGSGRYVGPVNGVIELAHRLDSQDFIHPGKVRLHRAS